jgi:hypothetical protein
MVRHGTKHHIIYFHAILLVLCFVTISSDCVGSRDSRISVYVPYCLSETCLVQAMQALCSHFYLNAVQESWSLSFLRIIQFFSRNLLIVAAKMAKVASHLVNSLHNLRILADVEFNFRR